ncbi:hypothetical protein [Bifidobacterium choloepi]|uniref:DUF4190 domain-containing protein n=1 Tax=Bifidobacterium choloepi TaxID=2614131 RepID=A0A6I5N190_9BIFI|nr:hypothetical protein [Bifidobacterium choloepi]NEG70236.1 hypothetical protein [Bifidobacterium choloepi]
MTEPDQQAQTPASDSPSPTPNDSSVPAATQSQAPALADESSQPHLSAVELENEKIVNDPNRTSVEIDPYEHYNGVDYKKAPDYGVYASATQIADAEKQSDELVEEARKHDEDVHSEAALNISERTSESAGSGDDKLAYGALDSDFPKDYNPYIYGKPDPEPQPQAAQPDGQPNQAGYGQQGQQNGYGNQNGQNGQYGNGQNGYNGQQGPNGNQNGYNNGAPGWPFFNPYAGYGNQNGQYGNGQNGQNGYGDNGQQNGYGNQGNGYGNQNGQYGNGQNGYGNGQNGQNGYNGQQGPNGPYPFGFGMFGPYPNGQMPVTHDGHTPKYYHGIDVNDPAQNPFYNHWDANSIFAFVFALIIPMPIVPALWAIFGMWRTKKFHMKGFGLAVAALVISVLYTILYFWMMKNGISTSELLGDMQTWLQQEENSVKA